VKQGFVLRVNATVPAGTTVIAIAQNAPQAAEGRVSTKQPTSKSGPDPNSQ
jgi:hypothetical protein